MRQVWTKRSIRQAIKEVKEFVDKWDALLKKTLAICLTETYDYREGYCRYSLTLGDNCVYYCVHDWRTLL